MSTALVESPQVTPEQPGTLSPLPQYARGFDGMATEPFPEQARRVLAEPVDGRDVEIKPDGIVFLPGVAYRRILTRAFGAGGWAIAPRSAPRYMKEQNLVVWHCALFALGRFVAEAVGECFYRDNNPNMSYASAIEGAKTDALGRCCKDLGIATEMWDANWREKWKAQYATSYKKVNERTGKEETKWKLKSRVSNPHDLMAGAGGVAPPAAPSTAGGARTGGGGSTTEPDSDRPKDEGPSAGSPSARSFDSASASSTTETHAASAEAHGATATADTGEAATAEQKESLRNEIRKLQWKKGYARQWFRGLFGFSLQSNDPLEELTQDQADSAYFLILAHGKPLYDGVLAELKAKGKVL